ncbi:hypothetical protein HQ571_03555 [Candidatus Kuenenbacteria bacterium]|nr:hypothetical protein [Candidatus Kuenenbacteria bacterium]
MKADGTIERMDDGSVVVEVLDEPWSLDFEGVKCANPDAPTEERIYRRVFREKKIYLPGEYDRAVAETIAHPDSFVFSMNGYSRITDEQCRRYGIQPNAYEEACAAIMRKAILCLREKFHGAKLQLVYGASDTGVDKAIEEVAREFNIVPLGFSCIRYMLYVKDDEIPVFVAGSKDEYADLYIKSLDLLFATGGREHALQHDVLAACIYGKRIHFVDILNGLSNTGGVPATVTDEDGNTRVDNAAAAMGRNVSFFSREDAVATTPLGGDRWDAIFMDVASVATQVCRQKMSPARKFK